MRVSHGTPAVVVVAVALAVLALARLARWLAHRDGRGEPAGRGRPLVVAASIALVGAAAGITIDRTLSGDGETHTPAPTPEAPEAGTTTT